MNNVEKQLQSAAARIEASVSPELRQRLDSAIDNVAAKTTGGRIAGRRHFEFWNPRLAGGFALGAAIIIAVLAWPMATDGPERVVVLASAPVAPDYQDPVARFSQVMDVQVAPEAELENELQRLNSDWQRIRSRVRQQIDPML